MKRLLFSLPMILALATIGALGLMFILVDKPIAAPEPDSVPGPDSVPATPVTPAKDA